MTATILGQSLILWIFPYVAVKISIEFLRLGFLLVFFSAFLRSLEWLISDNYNIHDCLTDSWVYINKCKWASLFSENSRDLIYFTSTCIFCVFLFSTSLETELIKMFNICLLEITKGKISTTLIEWYDMQLISFSLYSVLYIQKWSITIWKISSLVG